MRFYFRIVIVKWIISIHISVFQCFVVVFSSVQVWWASSLSKWDRVIYSFGLKMKSKRNNQNEHERDEQSLKNGFILFLHGLISWHEMIHESKPNDAYETRKDETKKIIHLLLVDWQWKIRDILDWIYRKITKRILLCCVAIRVRCAVQTS